jgi:hypothetical protein
MEFLKGLMKGSKGKRTAAVLIALCLISGAVYLAGFGGRSTFAPDRVLASVLTLTATAEDSLGISLDTQFILKSDVQLQSSDVRHLLETEPEIHFLVEEQGGDGKAFIITPTEVLDANKVYRFRLGEGTWSFQTKNEFTVLGSLPRDKGWAVPVNTGIEIVFSHENYQDIEEYFEITPRVEGFFERHKRTAVFVPKGLQPGTIYTVRVKKGLGVLGSSETLKEDFVFQFETQSTEAAEGKGPTMEVYFSKKMYEYPVGERPLFDFGYYRHNGRDKAPIITVDLYKYKDVDGFIDALKEYHRIPNWAYCSQKAHRAEVSGLERVASFQPPMQQSQYNHYIIFPEGLAEGHYLADIVCTDNASGDRAVNQVWLQVTDITGYVSASSDKTLVWVNDIDGGPVKDARVEIAGAGEAGRTGSDGVLTFDTPEGMKAGSDMEASHMYIKLSAGSKSPCVIPVIRVWYDYYYGDTRHQDYWSSIHFDRQLYQPADTVSFWGIIRPMDGRMPEGRLEAVLQRNDYYYGYGGGAQEITTLDLKSEKDGTFAGELKLPGLSPGHYHIAFRLGDQYITGKWFEVASYTKPAYRIEISKDKRAVFSGKDKITFDIKASFFEGTPVSSMQLSCSGGSDTGTVTTDEEGRASVTLLPKYRDVHWASGLEYFSVYNLLPEAGEIYGITNYMVFHNDMDLQCSVRATESGAEVSAKVNWITLDRINDGGSRMEDPYYDTSLYIGDPVPGQAISGRVYENRWRREERGKYYDFINKEVRTSYFYYPEYIPVTDFTITTDAGGKGSFVFPYEDDKAYRVDLETTDGMGRRVKREQYFYGSSFVDYQWQYWDYYHLEEQKEEYRFYRTGEEYCLSFKNNNEMLPEGEGSHYLYQVNQKGLKGYRVDTAPCYRAAFREEDIPSLHVTGVYFNGRTYHKTSPWVVQYDRKERELKITVTADREIYRPGEEATLDIFVKDALRKPREATVNISLVDEAMYQLMGEDEGVLEGLYSRVLDSGIISDGYSHLCPDMIGGPGAEGGEGGGERKDFRDTAYFGIVKTDRQGRGSITIKLPDNLTSWRATYNAVTGDLRAGSGSISLVVKLPFFADMIINDSYLEGDRPHIALRSYGDAISSGDSVEYKISAPTIFKGERLLEADAFEAVWLEMPPLSPGAHLVTVKARCGEGLTDTLTREIMVYDSYLNRGVTEYYTLSKGMKIKGSGEGLTKLVFTDRSRGMYIGPLYQLYYNYGKRVDQRLAKQVAYSLLEGYFDTDLPVPDEFDVHSYQAPDGGISLLPYSESEAALSAKVAALGVEGFDRGCLEHYFYKLLFETGKTEEEVSCALWGLAALDQPVLNQVKTMLEEGNPGVKTKLQLGLALGELGSGNHAAGVLDKVLKEWGKTRDPYVLVDSGAERDDVMELTSLAALLAARVNHPAAEAMFMYITDNSTKDILVLLEQAMYLSEMLAKGQDSPAEFSYRLDGKRTDISLEKEASYSLLLTPERLAEMEILEVKGEAALCSIYEAAFLPEDTPEIEGLAIRRQYLVNDRPVKEFNQSDIVKVVIDYSFGDKSLEGSYRVSDFLPSGLKIIAAPYTRGLEYSNIRYPYEVNGQKVSFYLYNSANNSSVNEPVVYYARVVSKGSFRAQAAFLQNMKADGEIKMTNEETVTIR